MTGDRQNNLHMKFSASNVDFSSPSSDHSTKSGYFTAIGSPSVKTVADRHRRAVYRNKHWWWAF